MLILSVTVRCVSDKLDNSFSTIEIRRFQERLHLITNFVVLHDEAFPDIYKSFNFLPRGRRMAALPPSTTAWWNIKPFTGLKSSQYSSIAVVLLNNTEVYQGNIVDVDIVDI